MNFASVRKIVDEIYTDIDGFETAKEAVKKSPYYYIGMIYDEVTDKSFYSVITKIKHPESKTFIDLGSGVGRKVFLASCYGFSRSIGLEILPEVFQASRNALSKYRIYSKLPEKIDFFNIDFNSFDLTCGDVFYMSLSKDAMEIELTGNLMHKLECLRNGTMVITTGLPVISPYYRLIRHDSCRFSKSDGDVFYNERYV